MCRGGSPSASHHPNPAGSPSLQRLASQLCTSTQPAPSAATMSAHPTRSYCHLWITGCCPQDSFIPPCPAATPNEGDFQHLSPSSHSSLARTEPVPRPLPPGPFAHSSAVSIQVLPALARVAARGSSSLWFRKFPSQRLPLAAGCQESRVTGCPVPLVSLFGISTITTCPGCLFPPAVLRCSCSPGAVPHAVPRCGMLGLSWDVIQLSTSFPGPFLIVSSIFPRSLNESG